MSMDIRGPIPQGPLREIRMDAPEKEAELKALLKEKKVEADVKFINKDLHTIESRAGFAKKMGIGAFVSSGVAAAIVATVASYLAYAGATAAAIGVAVTPVGWAALGLLAIGGMCLLARHLYLQANDIKSDIRGDMVDGLKSAAIGFGIVVVLIAICSSFSDFDSGFGMGFAAGLAVSNTTEPFYLPSSSNDRPEEPVKKDKPFLLFKGDVVVVEKDSKNRELIIIRTAEMQRRLSRLERDAGPRLEEEPGRHLDSQLSANLQLAEKYAKGDKKLGITENAENAFHYYQAAAASQDVRPHEIDQQNKAKYELARRYEKGVGTQADKGKAAELYKELAANNHAPSQAAYGRILINSDKQEEGAAWLRRAADAGNPEAAYELGKMYEKGFSGEKPNLIVAQGYYARARKELGTLGKQAQQDWARLQALNKAV